MKVVRYIFMDVCEKCGAQIDEQTGLCNVCDIVEITRKKADAKRKKTLLITLCVLLVTLVIAGVMSISIKNALDQSALAEELSRAQREEEIASYYTQLIGVYEGSYVASQGESGLTLTIYEEEGEYYANFKFYNLPDTWTTQDGEYILKVNYNEETEQFDFIQHEWIEQPAGYYMIDLSGSLVGDVLSGTSPYEFSVTRVVESVEDLEAAEW